MVVEGCWAQSAMPSTITKKKNETKNEREETLRAKFYDRFDRSIIDSCISIIKLRKRWFNVYVPGGLWLLKPASSFWSISWLWPVGVCTVPITTQIIHIYVTYGYERTFLCREWAQFHKCRITGGCIMRIIYLCTRILSSDDDGESIT